MSKQKLHSAVKFYFLAFFSSESKLFKLLLHTLMMSIEIINQCIMRTCELFMKKKENNITYIYVALEEKIRPRNERWKKIDDH